MTPSIADLRARLAGRHGVLVGSNVLLDVSTEDPIWEEWSARAIAEIGEHTALIINPIVYAEVSAGYQKIEEVDAVLPAALYQREALPWEAGFLAGQCFVQYRRHGGLRRSPLPDFYIGAHAAIRGLGLLTRDAGRYRSYFPTVEIFAPTR